MKKLLLIAAMAVMTLGAWAQSASDYGIVMEQPAGELRTYDRAGYAYYYSGEYIRRGAQTGTIDIVFGEDNKIFSDAESVVHYDIVKAVEGEESPLQKYVFELKQYKEAHPERYQQIEHADNDWQIAMAESGTAYFIVKAPRSARLSVRIRPEEDAKIISLIELLEDMRVDENAQRTALPDNWQQLSSEAIKTYNQYFVRINKSRVGDKRTQALDVIVKLYNNPNLSDQSKKLLKNARKLADKGSFDIIKKMLAIGTALEEKESTFFAIGQQDIDAILEREIGKLVANVENRQGEATIVLGTIK